MINERSPFWLLPTVICLTFALCITVALPGWNWALYDDMEWVDAFLKYSSPIGFLKWDWTDHGRIRWATVLHSFIRFKIFGVDAHLVRVVRIFEFFALCGLFIFYLRRRLKVSWLFCALGLSFCLKAPPVLEQIRWLTLHELPAMTFFFLALLFHKRRVLLYIFLLGMVLFKEPFAIFIALPALLNKKYREAFVLFVLACIYLTMMYLFRRGYSATYSFSALNPNLFKTVGKGLALDFIALLPLFIFLKKAHFRKNIRKSDTLWAAFLFFAFGWAYFFLVLPKAWGYCYMLAPSLIFFGLSIASFLDFLQKEKRFEKKPGVSLLAWTGLLCCIFPLRIDWNWMKVYLRMKDQTQVFEQASLLTTKTSDKLATNCHLDFVFLKNSNHKRLIKTQCSAGMDITQCCKEAKALLLFDSCDYFDILTNSARQQHMKKILSTNTAHIYSCN